MPTRDVLVGEREDADETLFHNKLEGPALLWSLFKKEANRPNKTTFLVRM